MNHSHESRLSAPTASYDRETHTHTADDIVKDELDKVATIQKEKNNFKPYIFTYLMTDQFLVLCPCLPPFRRCCSVDHIPSTTKWGLTSTLISDESIIEQLPQTPAEIELPNKLSDWCHTAGLGRLYQSGSLQSFLTIAKGSSVAEISIMLACKSLKSFA